jgi:hypothetical protein
MSVFELLTMLSYRLLDLHTFSSEGWAVLHCAHTYFQVFCSTVALFL